MSLIKFWVHTSIWYWYGVGSIKFETFIFTEVIDAAYPEVSTRHKKEVITQKFNQIETASKMTLFTKPCMAIA